MIETSIVRENLMTEKGYSPYCGHPHCAHNSPRTKWNKEKEQFVCSCGWTSEFPADFIKRYKEKWNF